MDRFGLSGDELRNLILSVGRGGHRVGRPYSPIEVAQKLERMTRHGASLDKCASVVSFEGTTMVSRFLKLLNLNPNIQHNVDWGHGTLACLGFTAAWQLSRLPSKDHEFACQSILEHQFKSKEVEGLVQLRRRSGKTIEECVEQIIQLRPSVVKRYMFVGPIIDQNLREMLQALTQNSRDDLFAPVIHDLFPSAIDANGRLGFNRFSVVGDSTLNDCVQLLSETFVEIINKTLGARMTENE